MIHRYARYIARQLTYSGALITLSLTSIVWLTQALRLMDVIVNQGLSLNLFLVLTLLTLPALLLMIMPVALFCAGMFTYNKLRQDSELIVLQASGLGVWQLARPALAVAGVVTVLGYVVAFWLMPLTYGQFKDMQTFLRNHYASVMLQEGVFNTPIEGLTVFVHSRDSDDTFHGILVQDSRQQATAITMMADTGRLVQTPGGQRFMLTHGNRQEMRSGRLSLLYFDSYGLDLGFYGAGDGERALDPREMFLPELLKMDGLTDQEIAARRQELHQRLTWPPYALTFMLVALAALLSGEFNRRGNYKRLAVAGLMVTLLAFSAVALRNLAGITAGFTLLAYLNLTAPALIAALLLDGRLRLRTMRGLLPQGA